MPVGMSWMWTLAFGYHEDRTPTHGTRRRARGRDGDRWPNTFGDARVTKVGLTEFYSPKSHFEPHMCSTEGREVYETSDPVRFHC